MLVLFAVVVLRNAWVGDDSYIAFRVVDNFVNGYGLRWNIAERVQAFTSPLWVLLVAIPYFFTREAYFTSLILSLILDLAAIWLLLFRASSSINGSLLAFAFIISSNALIDYSTSGLENPLLYLLIVLFFCHIKSHWDDPDGLTKAILIASLIGVTRLDTLALVLPACAILLLKFPQKRFQKTIIGLSPLILWELFSLIYFGSLVPNTFYAKVPGNIPRSILMTQGFVYFLDSITHDPFTLTAIALGLMLAVTCGDAMRRSIAAGIVLQLYYVLAVGGDFMSGRFFTTSFIAACCIIGCNDYSRKGKYTFPLLLLWIFSFVQYLRLPINSPWQADPNTAVRPSGIADERVNYVSANGLMNYRRDARLPVFQWRRDGERARLSPDTIVPFRWVGLFGYYAGPDVHIIDLYALADAFLSHLPIKGSNQFRIGHFERVLPEHYISSLENHRNEFVDRDLSTLFEETLIVTRGPLFTWPRFQIILRRLLTGTNSIFTRNLREVMRYSDLQHEQAADRAWNARGNIVVPLHGVQISLDKAVFGTEIRLSLDCNDDYQIWLKRTDIPVYSFSVRADTSRCPGVVEHRLSIPTPIANKGYDAISIDAVTRTDYLFALGYLWVDSEAQPSEESASG